MFIYLVKLARKLITVGYSLGFELIGTDPVTSKERNSANPGYGQLYKQWGLSPADPETSQGRNSTYHKYNNTVLRL